jgi:hypothetical protein
MIEEEGILPVPEPAHGLAVRRIRWIPVGDRDAPGGQEVPDPVVPGFAVHVLAVVGPLVERFEGSSFPGAPLAEVLVEEPLPRGRVHRGSVGDHAVHVEDHRTDAAGVDRGEGAGGHQRKHAMGAPPGSFVWSRGF